MIKSVHDLKDRTMMYQAMGRLTYPEIRTEVLNFSAKVPASKVLCDLTQGTVSDLTSQELEGLLKIIGQKLQGQSGGRVAIAALNGVDNGVARLFGTFVELANLPVEVKVFRTPEIARQWLQEV